MSTIALFLDREQPLMNALENVMFSITYISNKLARIYKMLHNDIDMMSTKALLLDRERLMNAIEDVMFGIKISN